MKRNCSLDEISDGKLYDIDDLVEVSCNSCKGSASCCHGMGNSIILDPFDVDRITTGLNIPFEKLLVDKIELNVVDGIILPNLKMSGASEGCAFLNNEGKCSIHSLRPGICRIFPLGRHYDKHDYKYFLQVNECKNSSRTNMKVGKWIDTINLEKNKQFLITWHYFLNAAENMIKNTQDEGWIKNLNMYILHMFYRKKYDADKDFYEQFNQRIKETEQLIND